MRTFRLLFLKVWNCLLIASIFDIAGTNKPSSKEQDTGRYEASRCFIDFIETMNTSNQVALLVPVVIRTTRPLVPGTNFRRAALRHVYGAYTPRSVWVEERRRTVIAATCRYSCDVPLTTAARREAGWSANRRS